MSSAKSRRRVAVIDMLDRVLPCLSGALRYDPSLPELYGELAVDVVLVRIPCRRDSAGFSLHWWRQSHAQPCAASSDLMIIQHTHKHRRHRIRLERNAIAAAEEK